MANELDNTDFIDCKNCGHITAVVNDYLCSECGEMVCLNCGCTNEYGCEAGCYWVRPGMCSECE